ncbi:MAG: ABC transporter ATP-binding protein [Candidatus Babeliales bacterium]
MSTILLSIRDVYKIYKDKKRLVNALDGVSLDIYEGEILSLLGVNGAGKTTLSSIIATLHPLTSGTVLYKNKSIYDNIISYRQSLGFCPQSPNLDPDLSVRDNLVFAGRYFLMPEVYVQERTDTLLEQFNLTRYKDFSVNALSGGYKQRLLIARAIVHNPKLLILDEPTVGLDPDIRHNMWEVIKGLNKQGMTILLTTHYLEEAEILADRVCILGRGKIVMMATVQDLKQKHKKESLEEVFLELLKEQEG